MPYLALFSIQIELVLANGHSPDGLYESRTRVPRVHSDPSMTKCPPGDRCPVCREMSCDFLWTHNTQTQGQEV